MYDYLIIFCASPLAADGRFSEATDDGLYLGGQLRMDAAVVAYKSNRVENLIVVGGGVDETDDDKKWLKVRDMKEYLVEKSVPEESILCIASQADTLGNLRAISITFRDQLEGKTVGLLTNAYHMPRLMRMAQDEQFEWNARFVPLVAEAFISTDASYHKAHSEGLIKRIEKENKGLMHWEAGTYTRQVLDRAEWRGAIDTLASCR